jgi:hypothetical protein
MNIPGTPIALSHSQRTAVGRKRKLTTENAETAAMYDPIIPPMWAYHQKFRSAGGRMNFQMSFEPDKAANRTSLFPWAARTAPTRAPLRF